MYHLQTFGERKYRIPTQQDLKDIYQHTDYKYFSKKKFYELCSKKRFLISSEEIEKFHKSRIEYRRYLKMKSTYQKLSNFCTGPNQKWELDLVYPVFQNETMFIFTIIDIFSKRAWIARIYDRSGQTIVQALQHIIKNENNQIIPKIIASDNGTEFNNTEV